MSSMDIAWLIVTAGSVVISVIVSATFLTYNLRYWRCRD